jgi:NAD(P)H-nitrite reductase large subunit
MVLPYYLDRSIAESHVFTATDSVPARWHVKTHRGRRAVNLDIKSNTCTLDDGTPVEYDDCLVATGSSAVRAPVPGADGKGVHSFWTLDEARGVIAQVKPGTHVVMVGAGFISFTILNSRNNSSGVAAMAPKGTVVRLNKRVTCETIARFASACEAPGGCIRRALLA